jgi:6-pyruvoyltetrahydropterin/6-carboxytetrahydropterin synthase
VYTVGVSDHVMVAHSLRGEVFGPAQRLHGATYDVRVEVIAPELDTDGIVVDIGRLREALARALTPLAYRNLDELPDFSDRNSTTEVLCRWVHERLAAALPGRPGLALRVTLVESPVAWASYEAPLG